jgi:glutathione S-transferase|eukprot:CAMPEP_0174307072 /NCGR_PEP_ID=MMETSP0810-20121108/883_1 /TAXON_ID=73025 ORGANISM="Eutreptiella gymnastica-like, Strain CCMP1594" /NCGR_SAMPLE_ID=MMETSP0810 /ASSEMBLY_ACC=CAM_ASM_000659 /LENGTH=262 /DNA_ID=CAMNT_0015414017 /DNA_START=14 /DNA_END=802 /DNA_ORIENTATION=+
MTNEWQSLKRMILAGSAPKPEVNKAHFRMYGHTLCPFVSRARYAFALKKIPFQDVQVDLNEKAQWHLDFNNGFVPVLETPAGDLIKESGVVAQFAHDYSSEGFDLWPKDPTQAAFMRLEMAAFDATLGNFFAIYMSRGLDDETTDRFGSTGLVQWENLCAKAEGKWLFKTEEPSMLDCHVAGFMELLYLYQDGVFSNCTDRLDLKNKAPNVLAYVERFRAHPLIHEHRFREKAAIAHQVRTRGWKEGEKCQLSLEVLEGAFD